MTFKKNIEYQYEMVTDDEGITRCFTKKKVFFCKKHKFASKDNFVDVTIKKTGKTIRRCIYCQRERLENKKIYHQEYKTEKENLTDYYVRRQLVRGSKGVMKMHEYPQLLVDAKRAVIKLKREKENLEKPLNECKEHGKLYLDDVIKAGIKNKKGEVRYRCKKCMKKMHAKHYELNKVKIAMLQKVYKKNNPEKHKASKKASRKKNAHKYREKDNERKRLYDRECTRLLKDRAIKKNLVRRTGLSQKDIPQELIELKRAVMMLQRGVKIKKIIEAEKIKNVED